MMKKIYYFFVSVLITIGTLHAESKPLVIGAGNYALPFVIQTGKQIYGFDIAMMKEICRLINRQCTFKAMPVAELISAVERNKVDAAVGQIAITPGRIEKVNFTIPYLPSRSVFITNENYQRKPFNLALLSNKTIGVEEATVFPKIIDQLGIKNATIITYDAEDDLIEAVVNKDVDFALVDTATAKYWDHSSGGNIERIGPELMYGFGLGIAVSPSQPALLLEINQALLIYLESELFHYHYKLFLAGYSYDKR